MIPKPISQDLSPLLDLMGMCVWAMINQDRWVSGERGNEENSSEEAKVENQLCFVGQTSRTHQETRPKSFCPLRRASKSGEHRSKICHLGPNFRFQGTMREKAEEEEEIFVVLDECFTSKRMSEMTTSKPRRDNLWDIRQKIRWGKNRGDLESHAQLACILLSMFQYEGDEIHVNAIGQT